jgi:hypothetical protein
LDKNNHACQGQHGFINNRFYGSREGPSRERLRRGCYQLGCLEFLEIFFQYGDEAHHQAVAVVGEEVIQLSHWSNICGPDGSDGLAGGKVILPRPGVLVVIPFLCGEEMFPCSPIQLRGEFLVSIFVVSKVERLSLVKCRYYFLSIFPTPNLPVIGAYLVFFPLKKGYNKKYKKEIV